MCSKHRCQRSNSSRSRACTILVTFDVSHAPMSTLKSHRITASAHPEPRCTIGHASTTSPSALAGMPTIIPHTQPRNHPHRNTAKGNTSRKSKDSHRRTTKTSTIESPLCVIHDTDWRRCSSNRSRTYRSTTCSRCIRCHRCTAGPILGRSCPQAPGSPAQ